MEKVTSADGTTIAFDVVGSGPAVVLVSGAIQHRAIDSGTARLAELLGERLTVAWYDRRGRGDSGDTLPYATEREIEDLAAVVAALGGSAHAYGMSSGCAVALDAAAAGVPLTKLALYEPPFIVDDSRTVPPDYLQRTQELRGGDAIEYFMVEAIGMPAEMVGGMKHGPAWPALASVGHTIAYDAAFVASLMQGPSGADGLRRWAGVEAPTLVIAGGDSPPFFHTGADALVAVLPNGSRDTAPGQTHQYDPEVVAPIVARFLA